MKKIEGRRMKVFALSLLFFICFVGTLFAEQGLFTKDGIKVGNATINSSVKIEERYDDNILLDPNNALHDYINVVTPNIDCKLPFGFRGRHLFQFVYSADIFSFSKYKTENSINQYAHTALNLTLPNGYLKFKDDFSATNDRSDTEFTELIKRNDNTGSVVWGIEMNKLSYELGYSHFLRRFKNSNTYGSLDYDEDIYTLTPYYQLFPKTKILAEYNHGELDYMKDGTRNGAYDQFRVGLKGKLTGKTIGTAKFGYQNRRYDNNDKKDYNSFVAGIGTETQFTDRRKLILKYDYLPQESTYSTDNFYKADRISTEFHQKIGTRMTAILSFTFEDNNYPQETQDGSAFKKRKDNLYNPALSLQYDIKEWASVKLGYDYVERDSNLSSLSYKRNLIFLNLKILM